MLISCQCQHFAYLCTLPPFLLSLTHLIPLATAQNVCTVCIINVSFREDSYAFFKMVFYRQIWHQKSPFNSFKINTLLTFNNIFLVNIMFKGSSLHMCFHIQYIEFMMLVVYENIFLVPIVTNGTIVTLIYYLNLIIVDHFFSVD